nr:HAD domain-containing protein [Variovorax sp. RA8]
MLFLDLDDVVCLNHPYGGCDVALALSPNSRGAKTAPLGLWDQLFNAVASAHLRRIDEEFRPTYVISSSWARVLDDGNLRVALSRGGLAFVVDSLHHDLVTPTIRGRTNRWAEISAWLQGHPEFASNWVVLDDELSGTGLDHGPASETLQFIVKCRENVGVTEVEYAKLCVAFQLRRQAGRGPE